MKEPRRGEREGYVFNRGCSTIFPAFTKTTYVAHLHWITRHDTLQLHRMWSAASVKGFQSKCRTTNYTGSTVLLFGARGNGRKSKCQLVAKARQERKRIHASRTIKHKAGIARTSRVDEGLADVLRNQRRCQLCLLSSLRRLEKQVLFRLLTLRVVAKYLTKKLFTREVLGPR